MSTDRARMGESPRRYVYPLRLAYESEQFRCQSVLCREARYAPAAIIIPWTTLPGFMLMAGGSLCALNINARSMGLNAVLAYQSHKKQRRGENPAYGLSGHGFSQPFILLKGQRLTGCPFVTTAEQAGVTPGFSAGKSTPAPDAGSVNLDRDFPVLRLLARFLPVMTAKTSAYHQPA